MDNPSSRSLTAKFDSLGTNVYVKTIYKGSGKFYSNLLGEGYHKIPTEGIVVSQGLWEFQAIFSSDGEKSAYTDTDEETATLPGGTSGVIFINLSTQSISVKLDEGVGSAVISYTLSGTDLTNPSIEVELYQYNGTQFEILASETRKSTTKVFSNTITSLRTGYYYAVFTVNSSTVQAVDTIGFVVRKGLTTRITGSFNSYNSSSTSGSGDYFENITNPPTSNKDTSGTITITNDKTDSSTGTTIFNGTGKPSNGKIHVITGGNDNNYDIGHTTTNSSRINTPAGYQYAINLNGTSITMTKIQQGNEESRTESALLTSLANKAKLTIYNHNGYNDDGTAKTGQEATIAYLQKGGNANIIGKRINTNIDVNDSVLNVLGIGDKEKRSNGNVIFLGPTAANSNTDKTLYATEMKQGSINLSGSGGNVVLDGNVTLMGFTGISSWSTKTDSSRVFNPTLDAAEITTNIKILNNASIVVEGDKNNGLTRLNDDARGIAIYGNGKTGSINITLDNGASIQTSNSGGSLASGIYIDNFKGTVEITLSNNSKIDSKDGAAIYLNNCTGNVSITVDQTSSINGSTHKVYLNNSNNVTINLTNSTISATNSDAMNFFKCSNATINLTNSTISTTNSDAMNFSDCQNATINVTNSTINATNGYAMYFSNCPDVTINYTGTNNISGTEGKFFGTVTENTIQ
ncbi:MAG: hypothetical protein SPF69_09900 [Candidatus Ornithospirochaeta sp.]|nr:hypothetical protein [Sphaerochaetaceae bacterium]MDY5524374.1 hypothetical protein [Candidatus Ornithospirochaeta sp.]